MPSPLMGEGWVGVKVSRRLPPTLTLPRKREGNPYAAEGGGV